MWLWYFIQSRKYYSAGGIISPLVWTCGIWTGKLPFKPHWACFPDWVWMFRKTTPVCLLSYALTALCSYCDFNSWPNQGWYKVNCTPKYIHSTGQLLSCLIYSVIWKHASDGTLLPWWKKCIVLGVFFGNESNCSCSDMQAVGAEEPSACMRTA